MQKVGVEAIVAGLSSFLGDMKKVDSSIKDLIPGSNLLSRAFEGVGSVVQWLTGSVFRVLEYTLGNLIAGAIRDIISEIKELVSATIEAGSEFQSLEIRLRNFNLNTLIESGQDYATASQGAIEATKEQLTWLQKLAATTPYDLTDIANVFTLARSYGFASEKSKTMTESITNFAAGMGLGNTEIERIIVNFGQMVQQGKVTQREMNDLARGAFVPVNDVLKVMQEQSGLTGDAFDDFRNSAEGVEAFMVAFETLVSQRFAGATQAMAQTWKGATDNVKDFIKSLFGLNVVKPVLDVLGKNIAEFINAFTSGQRWDAMVGATTRIGESLTKIISNIMHLGDGAEGMADSFLAAVEGVADWLETHQDDIQKWLEDGIAWIRDEAIPKVIEFKDFLFGTEEREGAIQKFGNWARDELLPFLKQQILPVLQDISDLIFGAEEDSDLATTLNEINGTPLQNVLYIIMSLKPLLEPLKELFGAIGDVIITAFGGEEPQTFSEFVTNTLVPAIQDLTKFVEENREGLANLLKALLLLSVIGTVAAWFVSLAVVAAFNILKNNITTVVNIILLLIEHLKNRFTDWKNNWTQTINDVVTAFKNKDWAGIGKAIIDGLIRGVTNDVTRLYNLFTGIASQIISNFKANLKIKSPSAVFEDFGEKTVQGFAEGITNAIGLAKRAMSQVTGATLSIGAMAPARLAGAMAPGTVSNNTTNNLTLNMHTSAKTEPIIADFEMMRSLVS